MEKEKDFQIHAYIRSSRVQFLCTPILIHWNYVFSKLKKDHSCITLRILEILHDGERKRFSNTRVPSIEQSPIPLHTDNSLDWNYVFSKLKRDHSCIRNEFYRYYTMEE